MEEAIVGCRESKGRKKIIRFPKDSIASTIQPFVWFFVAGWDVEAMGETPLKH